MTRRSTLVLASAAGLAGLLVALLLGRSFLGTDKADPEKRVHLRFAHWHLQSGLREAYEELIVEYEKLHPHVDVEQMVIPQRVWPAWHRTQLVGETAPDIIELGFDRGLTDELLARYYTPLTDWIGQPNPYNAGTDLAATPWRETFLDGLTGEGSYSANLAHVYGVPTALFTIRVYYNRDLLEAITGEDRPPQTYREFIALCQQVRQWAQARGEPLLPIAGSRVNAPLLLGAFIRSQMQVASRDLAPQYTLTRGLRSGLMDAVSLGSAFLRGEWTFDTPAVRDALQVAREVGQQLQPGFAQLERDDATFAFTRNRALMIASGTFDATSLREESPFRLGVFAIPLPGNDAPQFGRNVLGTPSEASKSLAGIFGLTRFSRHQDQAVDFLRFLTSRTNNDRFARASLWLPVVEGVSVPPEILPFSPVIEGPIDGADLSATYLSVTGYNAIRRAFQNHQHLLFRPDGGLEAFTEVMRHEYPAAIRADFRLRINQNRLNLSRSDPTIVAWHVLSTLSAGDAAAAERRSQLLAAQNNQEAATAELQWLLQHASP